LKDHAAAKQQEFEEFLTEMNDLLKRGAIRNKSDFRLWLEEVEEECMYCFEGLTDFVEEYMKLKFG
jgi:hypothetical protein